MFNLRCNYKAAITTLSNQIDSSLTLAPVTLELVSVNMIKSNKSLIRMWCRNAVEGCG